MSRVVNLIADACSAGVPFHTIGEMAAYSSDRIEASALDETTFVGVDNLLPNRGGKSAASHSPNTSRLTRYAPGDILLGNIRPYLKKVWLADNEGGCSGDVLAIRIDPAHRPHLEPDFLYYLLSSDEFFRFNMRYAKGAKMPRGSKADILKYRIPVPPIGVQREVVKILDGFTSLQSAFEAALDEEIRARRQQHQHYRGALLGVPEGTPRAALGDLVSFTNGKAHERLVADDGDIALMTARFISSRGVAERFVRRSDALTPALVNDIALVMSDLPNGRALGRAFFVDEDDRYTANQRVGLLRVIDESRVMPRYLFYVLDRNEQLLRYDNGQDQTHLKKGQILDIGIPVPSRAEQMRIVATLDRLSAGVNELLTALSDEIGARRLQSEYYRNMLLTFREVAA